MPINITITHRVFREYGYIDTGSEVRYDENARQIHADHLRSPGGGTPAWSKSDRIILAYHSTAGGFTLRTAGPKTQSIRLSGGPIVSSATVRGSDGSRPSRTSETNRLSISLNESRR